MKKKRIILILLSILVLISLITSYLNIKNNYNKMMKKIEKNRINLNYQYPYIKYFIDHFECPEKNQDVITIEPDNPDYNAMVKRHFLDHLSKKNEWLHYIPVYNRDNLKREAYVILSSGIDGKIDNFLNEEDTLYKTDYREKLKIYNPTDYYKIGDTIKSGDFYDFNIMDYFFGDKDYLVEYIDCIKFYKQQPRKVYMLSELIEKVINNKIRTNILCYEGVFVYDSILDSNKYVYFRNKGYLIKSQVYEASHAWKKNDTIKFIGTLKNASNKNKKIEFEHCIEVDKDFKPDY